MIEQLFVVLTEIFPFFNDFIVRQVAHAVFATIFVFFDFGFAALFDAEFRSRIGHADLRRFLFSEAEQAAKAVAAARLRIRGLIMACLSFEG